MSGSAGRALPAALVLDMDGTIVDTETHVLGAWRGVWEQHGHDLLAADWARAVGTRGGFSPAEELAERLGGAATPEALRELAIAAYRDRVAAGLEPRPGIVAWLDEAAAADVPVAVASSSDRESVLRTLGLCGLGARLTTIVAFDDVGGIAKPDPASYLAACAALGVEPADALALEDSPNGVAAAVAAGLTVVACPGPVTAAMDLSAAHLVVDDLAATSVADAWARARAASR